MNRTLWKEIEDENFCVECGLPAAHQCKACFDPLCQSCLRRLNGFCSKCNEEKRIREKRKNGRSQIAPEKWLDDDEEEE